MVGDWPAKGLNGRLRIEPGLHTLQSSKPGARDASSSFSTHHTRFDLCELGSPVWTSFDPLRR